MKVAEENGDQPSYLLKLPSDWQENGLTSISSINTYLENRQAKKQDKKSKNETTTTQRSNDDLYKSGYR